MSISNKLIRAVINLKHSHNLDDCDIHLYPDFGEPETEDGIAVGASVNCNDLFFWGCASGEDITTLKDVEDLKKRIEESEQLTDVDEMLKDKSAQLLIWCCHKRKSRPQGAAYCLIPEKYWPEINQYPERKTGFGNPHEPGRYKSKSEQ